MSKAKSPGGTDRELASKLKARLEQKSDRISDLEALIASGKDQTARIGTRRFLIEPADRDPNGLERVLGQSDLGSINFLTRVIEASRAVARIRVREVNGSRANGSIFRPVNTVDARRGRSVSLGR